MTLLFLWSLHTYIEKNAAARSFPFEQGQGKSEKIGQTRQEQRERASPFSILLVLTLVEISRVEGRGTIRLESCAWRNLNIF